MVLWRRRRLMETTEEEAEELPEDLIGEILLKVPIKPMMRLKTVSKDWLRLIHSNPFAFRPQQRNFFVFRVQRDFNKNILPISVLRGSVTKQQQIDLPQQQHHPERRAIFCIYPAGLDFLVLFKLVCNSKDTDLFLWNPTTKQNIVLPPSPYDPDIHTPILGFATVVDCKDHIDGTTFSFKVGRLLLFRGQSSPLFLSLSLELYSSKTKSWKLIPNFSTNAQIYMFQDYDFSYVLHHCVNLNGKVHWAIQSRGIDDHLYITAFDYETEVFTRIKGPKVTTAGYYDKRKCLVTLFDDKFLCLGLITTQANDDAYEDDEGTSYLHIWVLRQYEDENSWVKEFSIGPLNNKYSQVVGFSSKVQGVFLRRGDNLLMYDCKSSVIIDTIPIVNTSEKVDYVQVVEQVGSLFGPLSNHQ